MRDNLEGRPGPKFPGDRHAVTAKTLYFDESGYTGYNLLDPNQPVFAIASTDIEPAIAGTILRESFPGYQGEEFKFTNIWGSKSRRGLTEFSRRLAPLAERCFSWMADKRFCALTKVVDFLIEPFFSNAGYDFYSDGFAWKYTNYIYFGFEQFSPPGFLDRIVTAYQVFSRKPGPHALKKLQKDLKHLKREAPDDVKVFVDQMALGANLFTRFNNLATFKGSDEIQVTSMMAVVAHWRQRHSEDFVVVHDATANFFRRQELWARMTSADVPKQLIRASDGTDVEFPLRVVSTTPVDSRENLSVQFCDVLAGLTARTFDKRIEGADREFLNDTIHAGFGKLSYNGIRFEPVFPDQIPPRPLSGPDNPDKMAEIIFGAHHATRSKPAE